MRRSIWLAALALAAVLLFTPASATAQTLIYAQSGLPVTLDSASAQDGNSLRVAYQITEPLVGFEPGTANLAPALAERWAANADSTVWTFYLRRGVRFHDGTPFNAEAVKFNFERWDDPQHPYRGEGKGYAGFEYVFGGFKDENVLGEIEVVDEHTVRFHLTDSVGFFPAMVAAIYLQIDSPTAVMKDPDRYGTPEYGPVGTGPFTFERWIIGDRVILRRNDDYWGQKAKVDGIVFRGIPEPTSRLAELRAGAVHIAVELSPEDYPVLQREANLEPVLQKGLNIGYVAFHQAHEPLDDLRVRQAIAMAIDKQAIVDAFYAGLGSAADQFVPPAMWGRSEGVTDPSYDPAQARRLLAEAGYPNGFETEFWYMPVSRPYFPAPQPIAEAIASYLADVGIRVRLQTEDWGTYLSDYLRGKFPMYMLGWSPDYPDPDNYLFTFFGPRAPQSLGWDAPQVRSLLMQARTAPLPEERAALYAQVQEAVREDLAMIPFAHNNPLHATLRGVEGWVPSPLGSSENLNYVSVPR
ncbi:ABC transporter substrate-binding protein [Limnochorda pilosa]|uniref:ABC transporter substrate-binding protein n=1 Tax=Limnochorda pilosa TaxID=1555112 RepID=A0A0K2SIF3_LIMPI|nr:ABC transporter substrate-binding protein [Limnochorda pilosa]BAS26906.1 ABC transporter substrate-binding protein [Limnochorda pilosa]